MQNEPQIDVSGSLLRVSNEFLASMKQCFPDDYTVFPPYTLEDCFSRLNDGVGNQFLKDCSKNSGKKHIFGLPNGLSQLIGPKENYMSMSTVERTMFWNGVNQIVRFLTIVRLSSNEHRLGLFQELAAATRKISMEKLQENKAPPGPFALVMEIIKDKNMREKMLQTLGKTDDIKHMLTDVPTLMASMNNTGYTPSNDDEDVPPLVPETNVTETNVTANTETSHCAETDVTTQNSVPCDTQSTSTQSSTQETGDETKTDEMREEMEMENLLKKKVSASDVFQTFKMDGDLSDQMEHLINTMLPETDLDKVMTMFQDAMSGKSEQGNTLLQQATSFLQRGDGQSFMNMLSTEPKLKGALNNPAVKKFLTGAIANASTVPSVAEPASVSVPAAQESNTTTDASTEQNNTNNNANNID